MAKIITALKLTNLYNTKLINIASNRYVANVSCRHVSQMFISYRYRLEHHETSIGKRP